MIDLIYKGLPQCIVISGESFPVYTDYRIWMRFCNEFERWDQKGKLDISYIFSECIPMILQEEDIKAVLDFAYPPSVVPTGTGKSNERILDYEIDSDYIYSAFLGQYGIDLLETEMHWHKFCALLHGVNKSTRLHEIMGYRRYEGKDKDYQRLKAAWSLPVVLTEEDMKAKQEFDDYFG